MILKGYLFSILYGVICLAFAAVLHKVGVAKRITRKVVHILVGFEWVILYHFVGASYHFLAVCLAFLVLLTVVYKKRLMPMIESEGDNAPGTVYYAVAMSIMAALTLFVPKMILPFGIGVFCTSLGDGLAGLVGQSIPTKLNPKVFGEKSLAGAVVNLFTCFGVAMFFSARFGMELSAFECVAIAVLALELELFAVRGLDNVTITLGTSLLAFAFCNFGEIDNYIIPILLTPALVAFVQKKRALDAGGILAAIILDVAVSLSLGNDGFLILLSFLIGGLITDKIKKKADKTGQSERRNFVQVVSNGGVGAIFALAFLITKQDAFVVGFCASFAEALADTAASGIGAFSKNTLDPFRMKKCECGLSGGMSLVGTLASVLGALVITLISVALGAVNLFGAVVIVTAGVAGCIFDSFLGSLFQVKYICTSCKKITEKKTHCGEKTAYYRGIKFVDNNLVNFLGTLFAALLASVFSFLS